MKHFRRDIKLTEIIFATGNKDKMREIREIMADCDVPVSYTHLTLPTTPYV